MANMVGIEPYTLSVDSGADYPFSYMFILEFLLRFQTHLFLAPSVRVELTINALEERCLILLATMVF